MIMNWASGTPALGDIGFAVTLVAAGAGVLFGARDVRDALSPH
jgi:hypothetical protein